MSSKRLPKGAVTELVAMIREGLPYQDIADAFDVSPSAVTYYAARAGLARRGPNATAPAATRAAPATNESALALPLLGLGQMPDWMDRGLCAQTDPESFFPEKGGSTREAKQICTTCPVQAECLDYALDNDERFGIWGGLSERERRKVKKAMQDDVGLDHRGPGHNATKTHCVNGHAFTPENTYQRPNGGRTCRICNRKSVRALRLDQESA